MAKRLAKRPATETALDLPAITLFRINERVEQIHAILRAHDYGLFNRSAGLVDEILTDPRIAGVLEQRVAGLMAAPLTFEPVDDRRKSRRIADVLGGQDGESGIWRQMMPLETLSSLMTWGLLLGVAVAQIIWRRSARAWMPSLYVWHPQFLRWDWMRRTFVLLQQSGPEIVLPRPDQQPRGDGQWFVWCPYGVMYGWNRGLLRSLALPYLSRTWNERDWDRYVERQGMAILKLLVPTTAEEPSKNAVFAQLSRIGSEGTIQLPQSGNKDTPGFDLQKLEFEARTYEAMKERKDALDVDIAIRVLGQNLTTEVSQGSRAAAQTHNLIRLDKALADSEIGPALREQVLTWWSLYNYDDAEIAPWPTYNVEPPEDEQAEAAALKTLGEGVQALIAAEPRVDGAAVLEEHGIPLLSEEELATAAPDTPDDQQDAAGDTPETDDAAVPNGTGKPNGATTNGVAAARAALSQVVKRYEFKGIPVAIEYPAGSIKPWTGPDGLAGHTRMQNDYGHIEGHLSGDGEELDCYVGPSTDAADVHVVHQLRAPDYRAHDEDKVILGAYSATQAKAIFLAHRSDGERAFGGMSTIPLERFKAKLRRRPPESTRKIQASSRLRDTERALVEIALGTRMKRKSAAGRRRAAGYHDRLVTRSMQVAARALAPYLVRIRDEIDKAESLSDVRRRVLRIYRDESPARLAEVVKGMNVLARLAGRADATKQV